MFIYWYYLWFENRKMSCVQLTLSFEGLTAELFLKKIIKTIQSSTESSLIIIIIILWLRSSRPQVSSIDGCLEPSPTADCHLADYQDPPEPKKPSF